MRWLVRLFLVEIWTLVQEYIREYGELNKNRKNNKERIDAYKNARTIRELDNAFDNLP